MKSYYYFVEGECEQKLINALKSFPCLIHPGKVRVFNVMQGVLSRSHLYPIKEGFVVFVFDADVFETNCLRKNIDLVRKICPSSTVRILSLVQVMNLEEELLRSTNIRKITDLTNSKSIKDFKSDFIALKDCRSVLFRHEFDINKMWIQAIPNHLSFMEQGSSQIIL